MRRNSPSKPVIAITITPRSPADADRLARALAQLTADGAPQLRVLSGPTSSETELSFMNEQQLLETMDGLASRPH